MKDTSYYSGSLINGSGDTMLSPEEFTGAIVSEIEKASPELKDKSDLVYQETTKNNGVSMFGISIKMKSDEDGYVRLSPIIYLDDLYKDYTAGILDNDRVERFVIKFANDAVEIVKSSEENRIEQHAMKKPLDYEAVKTSIFPKVINTKMNEDFLKDVPHYQLGDLSVVFYIKDPMNALYGAKLPATNKMGDVNAKSTCVISDPLMKMLDIDLETLKKDAVQNAARDTNVQAIMSMITGLMPAEIETEDIPEPGMYVVTNNDLMFGACGMIPEILSDVADRFGCDLVVLPSSLHEVIVLPVDYGFEDPDLDSLRELVVSVNESQVSETERLSDNVYYFKYREKELTLDGAAIKLVSPVKEKIQSLRAEEKGSLLGKLRENQEMLEKSKAEDPARDKNPMEKDMTQKIKGGGR